MEDLSVNGSFWQPILVVHDHTGCAAGQHGRNEIVTVESFSLERDEEIPWADCTRVRTDLIDPAFLLTRLVASHDFNADDFPQLFKSEQRHAVLSVFCHDHWSCRHAQGLSR